MDVAERIRKHKPDITQSSVKTYTSVITNLAKKMDKTPDYLLQNPKKVMEFLKDVAPQRRKTILASMIVFIGDKGETKGAGAIGDLREMMMNDITVYNDEQKKQNKSEKEEENWIDWADVVKIFKDKWKHDHHLLSKSSLTREEKKRLMDLLLMAVYTLIPPRRSEDFTEFKVYDVDEDADNYMGDKGFVFSKYKTSKKYGKQVVTIPKRLRTIVSAIEKRDDWGKYLLQDTYGNKLTSPKITTALNKIFGKRVSSTLLRKSFLSTKYKNIPLLEDIQETSNAMGNSLGVALSNYVKPTKRNTKVKAEAVKE